MSNLKIPKTGIDLIKQYESCVLTAYPDPGTGGIPYTIGWGNTLDKYGIPFQQGQKITQQYADELLEKTALKILNVLSSTIPYWNEMNDDMRGSLLSFAYNVGENFYGAIGFSTITKVLKEKNWNEVPAALFKYRNPGSNVEFGLRKRRLSEGDLWIKGANELKKH